MLPAFPMLPMPETLGTLGIVGTEGILGALGCNIKIIISIINANLVYFGIFAPGNYPISAKW